MDLDSQQNPQPVAHSLMFWLLTGMAMLAALPCFVVPPIEAYLRLLAVEQIEAGRVKSLREVIAREERLCEAIRTDPQVNTRLAMRDLGGRTAAREVPVAGVVPRQPQHSQVAPRLTVDTEVCAPEWMVRLYPRRWAHVYRPEQVRRIIVVLSAAVICAALLLYQPRRQ